MENRNFATSHGKTACGGIGGTVKQLVSKSCLQRVNEEPTVTHVQVFNYYYDQHNWYPVPIHIGRKHLKQKVSVNFTIFKSSWCL